MERLKSENVLHGLRLCRSLPLAQAKFPCNF
jgi:hypothetical protein